MDIFTTIALWLRSILGAGGLNLAEWFVDLIMAIIRAGVLGTFGLLTFMVLTWVERKLIGRMQDRLGPTYHGPGGILIPIADGIKMITKEDTVPAGADKWVFNLAPILTAAAALIVFAVIPMGPDTGGGALVGTRLNIGLFYILAAGAAGIVAVIMAGWGSNNKFALLGAFRAVAQLISYEVPQMLSLVAVVMLAGTMDMVDLVHVQSIPFILPLFVTALIFFISGVAETGRSPFDLLEAESEIVAGFHIEYSAMKFSMIFLAEFVHAFAVGAVFVTLFLNGWNGPIPGLGFIWFLLKGGFMFFIMIWLRGTLPRFRIDQLMAFNWKFLVPLSLANLLMLMVGDRVLRDTLGWSATNNPWAWGLTLFAANLILLVVSLGILSRAGRSARRREELRMAARREAVAVAGR
ncbi:MAG TPA: NADH-quinone oxidoreductase subunit NuoH [Anaerolineae bacterium]|nr:NADH-quinone oxidoreductase subunit NuoH [Anaerolineae bacterium]